jgi:hypothetical protein
VHYKYIYGYLVEHSVYVLELGSDGNHGQAVNQVHAESMHDK